MSSWSMPSFSTLIFNSIYFAHNIRKRRSLKDPLLLSCVKRFYSNLFRFGCNQSAAVTH